jgi:hypothetical protein
MSIYIFIDLFQANLTVHCLNTRNKFQLHRPTAHLSSLYRGVFYAGTNIFSNLPSSVSNLQHYKLQFKGALQRYITAHSFDSPDELQANRKDTIYDYKL